VSLEVKHPQPRPGPTSRFQNHLESQAQAFSHPVSPVQSSYSDGGYPPSPGPESAAPPRPPKIPTEPVGQSRSAKIRSENHKPQYSSPLSSGHLAAPEDAGQWGSETGYDQVNGNGSPTRAVSGTYPTRKPIGPRPLSNNGRRVSGTSTLDGLDREGTVRRHRQRDTFGNGNLDEEVE